MENIFRSQGGEEKERKDKIMMFCLNNAYDQIQSATARHPLAQRSSEFV